MYIHYI